MAHYKEDGWLGNGICLAAGWVDGRDKKRAALINRMAVVIGSERILGGGGKALQ
jgi:hypothetical protein